MSAITLILVTAGLLLPLSGAGWWWQHPAAFACGLTGLATAILAHARGLPGPLLALLLLPASAGPLLLAAAGPLGGAPGMLLYLAALVLLAIRAMALMAGAGGRQAMLVPAAFGLGILFLWELAVRTFAVPMVLLPPPGAIGLALWRSWPVMLTDIDQTWLKAVIPGWLMGSAAGLATALLIDRSPFLQRGLLPLGNLASALPVVGIAPIMVMWFGFDWQSKAAVVVVMTFFPMLVNALEGLSASSAIERDLMRSFAASYWRTLMSLRLPTALPFLFNALKINATLALIGAIVAEFFGTPTRGMGFRISTELGRMNLDLVWATIACAACLGSLTYLLLETLERLLTFWHPSQRTARAG